MRKDISTTRKVISIIFLILSGPVCLVHRFLNNNPPELVHPFYFRPDLSEDLQWLIADLGECCSHIFVIFAMWLVIKQIHPILYAIVSAKLIIYLVDVVHYLLWFRQQEYVVFGEALIYLVVFVKLFNKYVTANGTSNEKAY